MTRTAGTADAAALLEVIVGQSPVGVGVFDTELRYVRVNPALQRLVGLDLADMLGRTVSEVVPGPVGAFAHARLRHVLATGEPVVGADLEGRLPTSPVERSMVVSYFRLQSPQGQVLGAASIVSDVSDRHRTKRALERANARLELLGRAGEVLNASLELAATLDGLARLVVPEVADHCVVDLAEDPSVPPVPGRPVALRRAVLVHAPGIELPPPAAVRVGDPWAPVGSEVTYPSPHPVVIALERDEATLVRIDPVTFDYDAVAPTAASASSARALRIRSALAVPLRARGRPVGVLSLVYSVSGRTHTEEELLLARQLADRAAVAIDNARLHERERERALLLQRSLLPQQLPDVPGLRTAARYLPADRPGDGSQEGVGGDWYDVVPLPGGRAAIVVGDVMGRGLAAAALMGQLRAALRAYAVQDQTPADVLTSADELVRGLADDVLVTCVYAVADPRDGTVTLANAGHVPPLLLGPGNAGEGAPARALEATGPPLGTGGGEPYVERRLRLAPGQLLALYTDGLVERRDSDLDTGVQALAGALDPATPDLDAACAAATIGADRDDDVALLLVRADPARKPPCATSTLAPDTRAASAARVATRSLLKAWDEPAAVQEAAELAVSELVTNAVRHGAGEVTLRLSRHEDGVVVEVGDAGGGHPRRRRAGGDDEGGRGLQLVGAVAAAWGVRPDGAGKIVWCRLARPRR